MDGGSIQKWMHVYKHTGDSWALNRQQRFVFFLFSLHLKLWARQSEHLVASRPLLTRHGWPRHRWRAHMRSTRNNRALIQMYVSPGRATPHLLRLLWRSGRDWNEMEFYTHSGSSSSSASKADALINPLHSHSALKLLEFLSLPFFPPFCKHLLRRSSARCSLLHVGSAL